MTSKYGSFAEPEWKVDPYVDAEKPGPRQKGLSFKAPVCKEGKVRRPSKAAPAAGNLHAVCQRLSTCGQGCMLKQQQQGLSVTADSRCHAGPYHLLILDAHLLVKLVNTEQ